jgi:hypothetical protein
MKLNLTKEKVLGVHMTIPTLIPVMSDNPSEHAVIMSSELIEDWITMNEKIISFHKSLCEADFAIRWSSLNNDNINEILDILHNKFPILEGKED